MKKKNKRKNNKTHLSDEISDNYGDNEVQQANKNWKSYRDQEKKEILEEGENIFKDLAKLKNQDSNSSEVQAVMIRWHKFIKNFYTPSIEVLKGLGQMYLDDSRFNDKFKKIDPDLPDFLNKAINEYTDTLVAKTQEKQKNILEEKH